LPAHTHNKLPLVNHSPEQADHLQVVLIIVSFTSLALCALCGDKCKTCAHVSSLLVNGRLAPVDERLGLAHSSPCSATFRPVPKQQSLFVPGLRRKVKTSHVHKKKKEGKREKNILATFKQTFKNFQMS
jgi:hypothetical protein